MGSDWGGITAAFALHQSQASQIVALLDSHPLLVLRQQAPVGEAQRVEFARALSSRAGPQENHLRYWEFGPVMNMKSKADAEYYLFSDEKVPFLRFGRHVFFCLAWPKPPPQLDHKSFTQEKPCLFRIMPSIARPRPLT